jgi:type IV pilus assembly protein PilP
MKRSLTIGLLAAFWFLLVPRPSLAAEAQEETETPSQKMKGAVENLGKAPAAAGKIVEGIVEAGKAKLQETLGGQAPTKRPESDNLTLPAKKSEQTEMPRYLPTGTRDPFRPSGVKTRTTGRVREGASPLERKDLGQFKLVGILSDNKEPKAMVEDTDGLGYTIKLGTRIGDKEGKVKAINATEVVVEEIDVDYYGARKIQQRTMKLPKD